MGVAESRGLTERTVKGDDPMTPIDVSVLDELVATVPMLEKLTPNLRGLIYTGVMVQMLLGAIRLGVTRRKVRKVGVPDAELHPFNRFLGRFGPVVNIGLGAAIAVVTTIPMEIGLLGGAFSSFTFALLHKTGIPMIQKAMSAIKPAQNSKLP